MNQFFDFLGRSSTALRKAAHLAGNHCKAATLFTGAGSFHCGIQCKDVGLKCDGIHRS